MPLGTVLGSKDTAPQLPGIPLLLAEFVFADQSTLFLSTHPLNATEGSASYVYNGNSYLARLNQQDLAQIQARSEQGIDRIDQVTLHLSDSDRTMLVIEKATGFAGAILTLRLVMWTADTSTFTSDSLIPFIGICNGPQYSNDQQGDVLIITATSSHNMARIDVPLWQVQSTCGNDFPVNANERLLGATDMSHHCWSCGYDPDQVGTDPFAGGDARRGNTTTPNLVNAYGRKISDGAGNFIWCGKTRADCEARGMFNQDSSSRSTKRFNGIEWAPLNREVSSKSYLEGKTIRFVQLGRNDTIFAERFPMLYGTQWVKPIVANVVGDANETRCEAVVCQDFTGNGDVGGYGTGIAGSGVQQVVLNGVILPARSSSPDNKNYFATVLASGARTGGINSDALYNSLGDPYGSLTTIYASVYRQLADSGSAPNIMVLSNGPFFKVPNTANPADQASWPLTRSTNPCWVLLDVLIWANWKYAEIDLQSFINESAYCDVSVTYTNLANVSTTHARFKAQFVLEKARKASEVITGILHCFNGQLTKDPVTGKLKLFIRKTLADQQGSPVTGSNYNTAIKSIHADGTAGNGYAAYRFDESTIDREGIDAPPHLPWRIDPAAQTPNVLACQFQDEDNGFQSDSIAVKDADAIQRAGGYQSSQEVPESYNAIGFSNFDQTFRVLNCTLGEMLRGNPRLDTGGTIIIGPFPVSGIRIAHLKKGDLVLVNWQAYGFQPATQLESPPGTPIPGFLARVSELSFQTNYQRAMVTLRWHEDVWYTDQYGQQGPPLYSNPRKGLPGRRPYPWQPFGIQPITNDSVYWTIPGYASGSWWHFGVAQSYQTLDDNTQLAKVTVFGCPPVNVFSSGASAAQPPIMGIQGTTAATGGTIPDQTVIYIKIAAIDASGSLSTLSITVTVATGGNGSVNTNTVTTPTIYWQAGTVGYVLYAGVDEQNLSEQATSSSSTPSTITLTALNLETYGPPDQIADTLHFRGKKIIHGGVWGADVASVSANTLTFGPPTNFTVNQWAGYDIMLVANPVSDTTQVKVANFRVTANDVSGNLTVTPDPVAAGIQAGSAFIMLAAAAHITATTIGDDNFVNPYSPSGSTVNEGQYLIRIIAGTGKSQFRALASNTATVYTVTEPWNPLPDATSRWVIEEQGWQYDMDVERISTSTPNPSPAPQVATINVDNFSGNTILLQVNVEDQDGSGSLEPFAPIRLIFIRGAASNSSTNLLRIAYTV